MEKYILAPLLDTEKLAVSFALLSCPLATQPVEKVEHELCRASVFQGVRMSTALRGAARVARARARLEQGRPGAATDRRARAPASGRAQRAERSADESGRDTLTQNAILYAPP